MHNGIFESGFKIPLNGDNRWITILTDTDHFATFAYATNTCLISGPNIC